MAKESQYETAKLQGICALSKMSQLQDSNLVTSVDKLHLHASSQSTNKLSQNSRRYMKKEHETWELAENIHLMG